MVLVERGSSFPGSLPASSSIKTPLLVRGLPAVGGANQRGLLTREEEDEEITAQQRREMEGEIRRIRQRNREFLSLFEVRNASENEKEVS